MKFILQDHLLFNALVELDKDLVRAVFFSLLLLYVDDTQSYLHSPVASVNDLIDKLNFDTESLVKCSLEAGLKLNANKTQAILVASTNNLKKISQVGLHPVLVDGIQIPLSYSVKNLGLKVIENLKWDEQITDIVSKTNKAL